MSIKHVVSVSGGKDSLAMLLKTCIACDKPQPHENFYAAATASEEAAWRDAYFRIMEANP